MSWFVGDHVAQLVTCRPSCLVAVEVSFFAWLDVDNQIVDLGKHLVMTVDRQLMGSLNLVVSIALCRLQDQSHHKHSSSHRNRSRNWYEELLVNCDSWLIPIEVQTLCRMLDHHHLMIVSSSYRRRHKDLNDCTCPTSRAQIMTSQFVELGSRNRYKLGRNRRWRYVDIVCYGLRGKGVPLRLQRWSQTMLVCVSFDL